MFLLVLEMATMPVNFAIRLNLVCNYVSCLLMAYRSKVLPMVFLSFHLMKTATVMVTWMTDMDVVIQLSKKK